MSSDFLRVSRSHSGFFLSVSWPLLPQQDSCRAADIVLSSWLDSLAGLIIKLIPDINRRNINLISDIQEPRRSETKGDESGN